MIDEATDVNMKANSIIYACLWDKSTCGPTTFYLKVLPLIRRDADGIYKSVTDYLEKNNIDITNMMGISTDGANVMIGWENGVCALLKRINPFLVSTHCIAHRLSLASNDAFKNFASLVEVETTLKSIYKYFKNSTTNISNLETIESIVREPTIRPKKVQDTRWIYIHRCIQAVKSSYKSLILFFKSLSVQEKDVVAQALHDKLLDGSFVQKFLLLEKVMEILNAVVMNFQRTNVNFGIVDSQITVATTQLLQLTNVDEMNYSFVTTLTSNDLGIQIKPSPAGDRAAFARVKSDFLKMLCANLRERFRHRDFISAFALLNIEMYKLLDPKSNNYNRDIENFGNEEIKKLADHYGKSRQNINRAILMPWIQPTSLQAEWPQARKIIFDRYIELESDRVWRNFMIEMQELYPNFAKLIRLLLVVPFSTVECERGFSQFNLIKTRLRNRLSPVNMDILMRLSVDEKDLVETDFTRALSIWHKKERRVSYI
jgi:hypothetical protein